MIVWIGRKQCALKIFQDNGTVHQRFLPTLPSAHQLCGQSYKASTIVIYESRVINMSNLLITTTLES